MINTDRELFLLIGNENLVQDPDAVKRFFESVLRRTCEIFGEDLEVHRACIYKPKDEDNDGRDDTLRILVGHGIGEESYLHNRWYIGPNDPDVIKRHRGTAGTVWVTGNDRVFDDAPNAPEFIDPYHPKRTKIGYRYLAQVVIWAPERSTPEDDDTDSNNTDPEGEDNSQKMGILSIDSERYEFTEDTDLWILQQVATRLAWMLRLLESQGGLEALEHGLVRSRGIGGAGE